MPSSIYKKFNMLRIKNILTGLAGLTLLFSFMGMVELEAQSRSYGEIFIPNKAFASIFSEHSFHDGGNGIYPGVISTEREQAKGYVNFIAGSSWVGASDMQHVDGYVKVYHNESFTFPIGANSKYRPVAISGGALTNAAYYDYNPNNLNEEGSAKTASAIQRITELEYWDVNGNRATQITLTWDGRSNIEALTGGDMDKLTIVGWNGYQWEVIPSSIDGFALDHSSYRAQIGTEISSFSRGSITTDKAIKPNDYDFYTFGAINASFLKKERPELDVFPNPQILRLELSITYDFPNDKGGYVRIYSPNNALVMEREVFGQNGTVKLPNVTDKAGVYVIGITDSKGSSKFQKLVVVEE